MKKTLLKLLLFAPLFSFAQKDTVGLNLPMKDNKIVYEEVVNAPGLTKEQLYTNAKLWFVDFFNSSKAVIQSEDKQDGLIIGKGIIRYKYHVKWMGDYVVNDHVTVKVECKDNKYRYTFYDQQFQRPEDELSNTGYGPERLIELMYTKRSNYYNVERREELFNSQEEIKKAIISLKSRVSSNLASF